MIYGLKEFIKKQFNTDHHEVVYTFPMLHAGWECDEEVALIQVEGKKYAIGTNHGSPCLLSRNALLEKAREYSYVAEITIAATIEIE